MVQLRFQQTRAPSFSSAAALLSVANKSQERAFKSAGDLLASYQEGQQDKVDNEVFSEIAGLDREGLQKYFDSNGLKGRDISLKMRDRLGKQFSQLATTAETLSGTGRAEAVEFRKEDAFTRTADAREADLRLKSIAIAAGDERFNLGLNPLGTPTPEVAADAPPAVEADVTASVGADAVKTPASIAIETAARAPGGGADAVAKALPEYVPSTPTETSFMSAVGVEVKNPYALAVIAATGQAESGFDPKNASGTWQDGKNRAGGIMSWNGGRLTNMQNFTNGDLSPEAQAAFFLQENPELMRALEASTSLEEANDLITNAWRFEGYKNTGKGSERAKRLASARSIYGNGPAAVAAVASGGPITTTDLTASTPPAAPVSTAERLVAEATGPQGPGGFRLTIPGNENVASGFATALPTLTDPEQTSSGVLPTSPTGVGAPGGSPLPAAAAATVPTPEVAPLATPSPAAADTIAAAAPAPVASPAMDAFRRAVLADDTISTAQATKLFADMDAFQEKGVAKRKAKRAEKVRGQIADMVLKNSADPKNHDRRAVVLSTIKMAQEAGLTSEEVLQSAEFASAAADGALIDLVIPKVTDNVMLDAIISTANTAGSTRIKAMPQYTLFALGTEFKNAESVTKGLIENLNLHGDGEDPDTWLFGLMGERGSDDNILTDHIELIASEAGVTPSIAAAAMVKNFIRDPAWTNTIEKRFPKAKILKFLEDNMSADAVARYSSAVLTEKARTVEFSKERLVLDIKQGTFNKMAAGPERDALGREIAVLVDTLSTGNTSNEGIIALKEYIGPNGMDVSDTLIRALESGNTEIQKEGMHRVETTILADKNLSPAARTLLLSTLKK